MSIDALRHARAAVLALTIASPAAVAAFADDGHDDLISIDQPTAFVLVMIDAIEFAGTDAAGTDYYALTSTGVVCYMSEKDARTSESEQDDRPAKKS